MEESFLPFYFVGYAIAFIGQIGILSAVIILLINRRSLAGIILLIGCILTFLMSIFSIFSNVLITKITDPELMMIYQGWTYLAREFFFLIFAVGLFLFILEYMKKTKVVND